MTLEKAWVEYYFFASLTAHAAALFSIFIAFALKFIAPEQHTTFFILSTGTLGVMGIITPYGTRPSPIFGTLQDTLVKEDGFS